MTKRENGWDNSYKKKRKKEEREMGHTKYKKRNTEWEL